VVAGDWIGSLFVNSGKEPRMKFDVLVSILTTQIRPGAAAG